MTIDPTAASARETEPGEKTEATLTIVPTDGNDNAPEVVEMGSYPEYWIG